MAFKIDAQKCVDRGLCKKNYLANNMANAEILKKPVIKCYASWSKDENAHYNSEILREIAKKDFKVKIKWGIK